MAKTKTGLEPPTSVLTADVPTICASHLLFYIPHLYTCIINRLGCVSLLSDSPCMHVYIHITTPISQLSLHVYVYMYIATPTYTIYYFEYFNETTVVVREESRGHKVALTWFVYRLKVSLENNLTSYA